jgi:hypothetical protein
MISGSAFEKQNGFSFASPQEPFVFLFFFFLSLVQLRQKQLHKPFLVPYQTRP